VWPLVVMWPLVVVWPLTVALRAAATEPAQAERRGRWVSEPVAAMAR
jgi:hypothetical protein